MRQLLTQGSKALIHVPLKQYLQECSVPLTPLAMESIYLLVKFRGLGEKPSVHFDPGKESHCSEPEKGVPEGPTAASHALLKRPLLLLSARNPSNCPPAPLRKVIKAVSIK